ncbi:hypothetical protein NIES2119_01290 [[Phormidium ambiguum] IAM M-71]|uniref:Uncharacterized protein n=1 Tax=[Phormidium ambiguum] IAM M-71 TaxID=454136 RepID=A0A1U7IU46_9CYAN|nr:hypothetical protein NIES2119_01290 [Phormidium ambiguum IAM M-71]
MLLRVATAVLNLAKSVHKAAFLSWVVGAGSLPQLASKTIGNAAKNRLNARLEIIENLAYLQIK